MYSQKHQKVKLLNGRERLFLPLGYAEENISPGETQLWQDKTMNSEQNYLEAVHVKLLDLYQFENKYRQYCQYINYLLFNAYLFLDSDIAVCACRLQKNIKIFSNFIKISCYLIINCYFPKRKNLNSLGIQNQLLFFNAISLHTQCRTSVE